MLTVNLNRTLNNILVKAVVAAGAVVLIVTSAVIIATAVVVVVVAVVKEKKVLFYPTMGSIVLRLGVLSKPQESVNTPEYLRRS